MALLWLNGRASSLVHHIEAIWSHNDRVHVAIVDQVSNNLMRDLEQADSALMFALENFSSVTLMFTESLMVQDGA